MHEAGRISKAWQHSLLLAVEAARIQQGATSRRGIQHNKAKPHTHTHSTHSRYTHSTHTIHTVHTRSTGWRAPPHLSVHLENRVFADVIKLRIWGCHLPGFRVDPGVNDRCTYKRKGRPCEDGGRDWIHAPSNRGIARIAHSPQKLE